MTMVRLTRIYTKTGDDGTTALGDGLRVPKTAARIEAYGTVDELSAVIGLCVEEARSEDDKARLRQVQNDLYDLGAELCLPGQQPRIGKPRIERIEREIDRINAGLGELTSFVLPGGTRAAATLHMARTVCRRAERRLYAVAADEPMRPEGPVYLNRLSDLLFVMARVAATGHEVLWVPASDEGGDGDA
jgi:cob(I)alamin adenosyltransferase